jgi:hypothetical protein
VNTYISPPHCALNPPYNLAARCVPIFLYEIHSALQLVRSLMALEERFPL